MAVLTPASTGYNIGSQGQSLLAALVQVTNAQSVALNEIKTDHNALGVKLDADAGVTDTNYAATLALAFATLDTIASA